MAALPVKASPERLRQPTYRAAQHVAPESQDSMSTNRTRLGEIFTIIGDALATAAAVSNGHQPKARNLRGLGIDPEQFRKIRL
jgi:hypothetical protein